MTIWYIQAGGMEGRVLLSADVLRERGVDLLLRVVPDTFALLVRALMFVIADVVAVAVAAGEPLVSLEQAVEHVLGANFRGRRKGTEKHHERTKSPMLRLQEGGGDQARGDVDARDVRVLLSVMLDVGVVLG